jgi:hypothetical protein
VCEVKTAKLAYKCTIGLVAFDFNSKEGQAILNTKVRKGKYNPRPVDKNTVKLIAESIWLKQERFDHESAIPLIIKREWVRSSLEDLPTDLRAIGSDDLPVVEFDLDAIPDGELTLAGGGVSVKY